MSTTDRTFRDFSEIVRALDRRRKDTKLDSEFLQAVQIAAVVKMNSGRKMFNHSIVSHVISQYKAYFMSDQRKPYPGYTVNWDMVHNDHPSIVPPLNKKSGQFLDSVSTEMAKNHEAINRVLKQQTASPSRPRRSSSLDVFCDEAIEALAHEYKQAEEMLLSHPVIVRNYRRAVDNFDTEASRIYEATLEYRLDEAPPIPEGAPVRVRWHYSGEALRAKLLQWDLLNNKVYLAFNESLDDLMCYNQSRIELTTHELIRPLQLNLEGIKSMETLVAWSLLTNSEPRRLTTARDRIGASLDKSQEKAVRVALENDFSIFWGPPGTGKTYTIGCLISELVMAGKRVLAASISNVAVDNMAIKFVQNMMTAYAKLRNAFEDGLFLRFGYTRNEELNKDKYRPLFSIQKEMSKLLHEIREKKTLLAKIGRNDPKEAAIQRDQLDRLEKERIELTKGMVSAAKVVFTTAAQVYINSAFESLEDYDVVIIDEASMMAVPTFMAVAARSRAQAVVVGDFRQLAPIAVAQSALSHTYLHQSPFEWLDLTEKVSHPAMVMLTKQRRMNPSISDWVSSTFYGGNLVDDVDASSHNISTPSLLTNRLILWDFANSRFKGEDYTTQFSKSQSRYNIGSARHVTALAVFLQSINIGAAVAIITTYREQAHQIRRYLDGITESGPVKILVGTVHTFQGSEADIVLWDMVDTAEAGFGQPYKGDAGDRLTNVAVSRAKKLMIVIGDRSLAMRGKTQSTCNKVVDLMHDIENRTCDIDKWLPEDMIPCDGFF